MIAIAIAVAAGPAGSGLTASMVATNAAGIALQTQAAITLINNKGDISKTLKDMASSDTVRNMTTAALTAGVGAQLGLGSAATDTFGQKLANGVGTGVTQAVVDATINGMSFEEALKNSLRSSLVDVFAAQTFSSLVKGFDSNDFADNLAHKLVAAGVGCVSASAKSQSCDAGAIGAAVGEMIGDYLVDNPFDLTDDEIVKITDIAKLSAGTVALLTNVDVNVAANTAGTAVKNNSVFKLVSSGGKILVKTLDKLDDLRKAGKKITADDIKTSFREQGADELLGIADDLLTVFNSSSSPTSRLLAGFDLVVGTDLKKSSGNSANLLKDDLQRLNIAYANRNKPSNAMIKNIATNSNRRTEVMFTGSGIRKVDVLVEKFGGRASDWTKKKGWDSNGKEYHWYQLKNGPTVGWKRAGENDPF
ncbi:DUF637 domain-containing protein [uncultured Psychrobacter sp.]|uniref:DUF637 domain-containing protein n=1 Tax=uncultured Psychrobacter sp. TaxID=259303 RepID=UPI00345A773F